MRSIALALTLVTLAMVAGCARAPRVERLEATAYCGCGKCCSWERGSWRYLKLNFWVRYVSEGRREGAIYTGHTASGTKPRQYYPGLFSLDTIERPWVLPFRVVLPWMWLPHDGTIAADTRHYPFGTRMYVPGYGWGVVEDRGGAIQGPTRIDLYYRSHRRALQWGRQHLDVEIYME